MARRGRKTLYDEERHCPWVEHLIRDGLTEKEAAKAMGISYPTLRDWKKKHQAFDWAVQRGRIPFEARMVNKMVELAEEGNFHALKFVLERRFHNTWRERKDENVTIEREITPEMIEEFEDSILR